MSVFRWMPVLVLLVCFKQEFETHMFAFGPSSPPSHHCEGPTFPRRCIHESVLGTTTAKAVCRKLAHSKRDTCQVSKLRDPTLDCVMGDWKATLQCTILTQSGKKVIVGFERFTINRLKTGNPSFHVEVDIHMWKLFLWVDFILVSFKESVSHYPQNKGNLTHLQEEYHDCHSYGVANLCDQQEAPSSAGS